MVTLKIEADKRGEFHIHGYDIQQDVGAAEVTDFFFEADTTGRFKITFHSLDEVEHGHEEEEREETEIGILEVRPR